MEKDEKKVWFNNTLSLRVETTSQRSTCSLCFNIVCEIIKASSTVIKYQYDNVDYQGIGKYLQEISLDQVITLNTIDECWEHFEEHLSEARDKFVPHYNLNKNKTKK